MEIELYAQHDRIICCNNACADRPLCMTTRFSPSFSSSSPSSPSPRFMFLLVYSRMHEETRGLTGMQFTVCERSKPESEMGFALNGRRETRFLWWVDSPIVDWRLLISEVYLNWGLRSAYQTTGNSRSKSFAVWARTFALITPFMSMKMGIPLKEETIYIFFLHRLAQVTCGQILVSIPTMQTTTTNGRNPQTPVKPPRQ